MSFSLGMPTLIELKDIQDNVTVCKQIGFDFIELNMSLPHCCPERLDPRYLKEIAEQSGIQFTVHLPEEMDFASFHPPIREGHIERCKESITWASQAGITLLNMHLNRGIYFTLPDQKVWVYEQHFDEFCENLKDAFTEIFTYAADHGVTICIENTCNFHIPFIEKSIQTLSQIEGFSLTWDVGHDAKIGFQESPILKRYETHIRHMHLHDYDGSSDHQILFSGQVDVAGMIDFARNRNISVVVETKTVEALIESARRLRVSIV